MRREFAIIQNTHTHFWRDFLMLKMSCSLCTSLRYNPFVIVKEFLLTCYLFFCVCVCRRLILGSDGWWKICHQTSFVVVAAPSVSLYTQDTRGGGRWVKRWLDREGKVLPLLSAPIDIQSSISRRTTTTEYEQSIVKHGTGCCSCCFVELLCLLQLWRANGTLPVFLWKKKSLFRNGRPFCLFTWRDSLSESTAAYPFPIISKTLNSSRNELIRLACHQVKLSVSRQIIEMSWQANFIHFAVQQKKSHIPLWSYLFWSTHMSIYLILLPN